ncbi:hypothetical protein AMTRI_Chr04g250800 [Amborella trichopoda]
MFRPHEGPMYFEQPYHDDISPNNPFHEPRDGFTLHELVFSEASLLQPPYMLPLEPTGLDVLSPVAPKGKPEKPSFAHGVGPRGSFTPSSKRKSGKKDRHSKIHTAQGPRDRRMRLSLDIARKFFQLQDRLGFDKASKTVDWLLTHSKAAIRELSASHHRSCTSERSGSALNAVNTPASDCEVISCGEEIPNPKGFQELWPEKSPAIVKEKKRGRSRKPAYWAGAKESREKARARARDRTIEKQKTKKLNESRCPPTITNPGGAFGSFSPLETGDESVNATVCSSDFKLSLEMSASIGLEPQISVSDESTNINNQETMKLDVENLILSQHDDTMGALQGSWESIPISTENVPAILSQLHSPTEDMSSRLFSPPFVNQLEVRWQAPNPDLPLFLKSWDLFSAHSFC